MSPLVSFFVSGESLYPGVILFLLPIVAEFVHLSSFLRWLSRVSLWIGLAFIVMASPPVSWTADVLFGVVFLTWLLFGTRRGTASQVQGALRIAVAVAVVTLLILVTIGELQRRRIPVIQGQRSDHLVVLGDSISAGIGTRSRPWPGALRQMTGVEITNLSLPGATILEAFRWLII